MKNNQTRFVVLFAAVAVLVFAVAVVLQGRLALAPDGMGYGGSGGINNSGVRTPVPDSVAVSAADADGDEVVSDVTAGYYFSMPSNWYVEKSAGAGLAVYPDYDPKSGAVPDCKIEISVFGADISAANASSGGANSGLLNLNDWITSYLHADPTADVAEISRTPVELGEAGGVANGDADAGVVGGTGATGGVAGATSSAIEWFGTLNGVATTLVYAAMPTAANDNGSDTGSENILEIAPSTLSGAGDADNNSCDLVLQALVANLQFGTYEK
jgi:hypothetical protein